MPEILRDYLVYMETIKGKSHNTIYEYFLDIRSFLRYMLIVKGVVPEETKFEDISIVNINVKFVKKITLSDIYSYFGYINKNRLKASTRARKVSSVRMFFKYLTSKKGVLDINPAGELETPKIKSSLPHYLTLEQSIELLKSIDGDYKERDYAIIVIFLNCGLRLSELVGINLTSIQGGYLRVLGKGNKERMVYLNEACQDAVERYLEVRPRDGVKDKNALFLSKRLQRISPKTVQWLVKRYLKNAGIDTSEFSTHKLRHTAATLMYRNGVDVRTLQSVLGHANLNTTQIYTHLSNEQLENAAKSNPLSNVKIKK